MVDEGQRDGCWVGSSFAWALGSGTGIVGRFKLSACGQVDAKAARNPGKGLESCAADGDASGF